MIAIPRLRSTAHGCVVAAVHSDCRHLDRIVARAIERAAIDDQPTIFLTVITERPLSTELTRIRMQLRRYPVPIHLVASWIDGAPVHGAAELGAASLVMGLHPLADVVGSNLASRVATLLPP
jgi:hypothetical protein